GRICKHAPPSDHERILTLPFVRNALKRNKDKVSDPYCCEVIKLNKRGVYQKRRFLLSDKALYNIDFMGRVKRRLPYNEIGCLVVSPYEDHYAVIEHEECDYLVISVSVHQLLTALMALTERMGHTVRMVCRTSTRWVPAVTLCGRKVTFCPRGREEPVPGVSAGSPGNGCTVIVDMTGLEGSEGSDDGEAEEAQDLSDDSV
ncbi:hypothetical protein KIPB_008238, partial [Kipferlia bialata]